MVPAGFMSIAHRGASAYAPENTFSAFDQPLQLGVEQVELDVHCSEDGHIVVIHDDDLDCATNGSGPVSVLTLAQLGSLDAGSWFGPEYAGERIPPFVDVLRRYKGRLFLHIEIKGRGDGLTQKTVDLVRAYDMVDSVSITSFQDPRLAEVRDYAPEIPSGWLVRDWDDSVLGKAKEMNLAMICTRADLVTLEPVDRMHRYGFLVRAWGVSTEELMKQVVEAGADGMTVNFPDKLTAYLERK